MGRQNNNFDEHYDKNTVKERREQKKQKKRSRVK